MTRQLTRPAAGLAVTRLLAWIMCLTALLQLAAPLPAAAQWRRLVDPLPCGGDSSVYGAHVFSPSLFAAVGEDGAAWRSVDGGATVQPMQVAGRGDLYAVHAVSASRMYVAGDSGLFAESSDGGATWEARRLAAHTRRALYAMDWLDPRTVLLAGGSTAVAHGSVAVPDGVLLRSTDAGGTWEQAETDLTVFFWAVAAERSEPPTGRVFAASYGPLSQGRIHRSDDWGAGWRVDATLPFLPHGLSVCATTAGTWAIASGGNPFDFSAAPRLAVLRPDRGWTVLPDTFSVRGFAWSALAVRDDGRTGSASIPLLLIGLQGGQLLASLDGGDTWHLETVLSPCAIYRLAAEAVLPGGAAASPRLLAAGGGRGVFVRDGAVSAETVPVPGGWRILSLAPTPIRSGTPLQVHVQRDASMRGMWAVLTVELHDALGRRVLRRSIETAEASVMLSIDVPGYPSGLFRVTVHDALDPRSSRGSAVNRYESRSLLLLR